MVKVIAVVDKTGTALDRLARGAIPYHTNIDYQVVDVHPKRPSADQLVKFEQAAKDADIIDYLYYRSADMLRVRYPWLKSKASILTHHNPYGIKERDWNDYDLIVGCNQEIYKNLGEITIQPVEYIPLTVDTDFWTFNTQWNPNDRILMVANRIESKKGILEVAQACQEIGAQFVLVGAISDSEYFHEIIRTGNVEFHQQISDEELRKLYWNCTIHVCNSVDNFESGTLPMLESMLCGTPVLTRKIGHVPELYNGENMVINEKPKEDIEQIARLLKDMLADSEKLKIMRDKAWQTAKSRSHQRRAYLYQKLYRQVLFPNEKSVTVVTPVCEKPEITEQNIEAIANQTYKNIEHIIINDGQIEQPQSKTPFSRVINNFQNDYGLARARNKGIIEATGDVIVFADQRIILEPTAIEEFVLQLKPGTWVYGQKNGVKKEFIENFSAIYRDDIIRAGMFNERINMYGGMSQEIRNRFRIQGKRTEYVEQAKAKQIGKSSNRNRKRDEIIEAKNMLWRMGLE